MDDGRLNQWARAHREGEDDALRPLVEALTRPLLARAYRYVGDWESARDLTQETWLRVHRSIESWDPGRPVRPWIFTIHRHLCLDHLRSRTETDMLDESTISEIADPGGDPIEQITHRQLLDRIHGALSGLSEVQRRILTMVDIEELRPAEVAAAIGMKPTTVRTTLYFARRKLARLLGREHP